MFWLVDQPRGTAFPPAFRQWLYLAPFVLTYSGGTAVDLHHLPQPRGIAFNTPAPKSVKHSTWAKFDQGPECPMRPFLSSNPKALPGPNLSRGRSTGGGSTQDGPAKSSLSIATARFPSGLQQ